MGILKKNNIPGFNSTTLPADVTFSSSNEYLNTSIQQGMPTDTTKYFVLPLQGGSGYLRPDNTIKMSIGSDGVYWTRDAYDTSEAWCIGFSKNGVGISKVRKTRAFSLWTVQ